MGKELTYGKLSELRRNVITSKPQRVWFLYLFAMCFLGGCTKEPWLHNEPPEFVNSGPIAGKFGKMIVSESQAKIDVELTNASEHTYCFDHPVPEAMYLRLIDKRLGRTLAYFNPGSPTEEDLEEAANAKRVYHQLPPGVHRISAISPLDLEVLWNVDPTGSFVEQRLPPRIQVVGYVVADYARCDLIDQDSRPSLSSVEAPDLPPGVDRGLLVIGPSPPFVFVSK